jgi:hypothetical protein
VEITVRNASGRKEKKYVLHRLILSQCSGFFEAGTRAEWSARAIEDGHGNAAASLARISESGSVTIGSSSRTSSQERRPSYEQNQKRWYYELDWSPAGDDDIPMLVQKNGDSGSIFGGGGYIGQPPPVRNKPPASSENFFRSVSTFASLSLGDRPPPSGPPAPGDEIMKDYDNLFRTMYNYPPSFDTINIATAYTECKALLHLADMYDALEIVGSRVDHHLLRFGARLFKQIAKYPPSYLKVGWLARSRQIYSEAMIHVVGQWPLAAPQLRGQVETSVMEIIEDKVDELKEMEEKVESKLWRLNLTTSRGERVTPTNDFLSWLAVSLFRQWLAENTTSQAPTGILKGNANRPDSGNASQQTTSVREASRSNSTLVSQRGASRTSSQQHPPAPPAPVSAGKVYRLIGSVDPSAYLNRDDLKRFLKSPGIQLGVDFYHRDNLKRFERRVDEIKNLARDVVKPLMRNFLELDLRDFGPAGLGYLTCTRIEARDLPWDE